MVKGKTPPHVHMENDRHDMLANLNLNISSSHLHSHDSDSRHTPSFAPQIQHSTHPEAVHSPNTSPHEGAFPAMFRPSNVAAPVQIRGMSRECQGPPRHDLRRHILDTRRPWQRKLKCQDRASCNFDIANVSVEETTGQACKSIIRIQNDCKSMKMSKASNTTLLQLDRLSSWPCGSTSPFRKRLDAPTLTAHLTG